MKKLLLTLLCAGALSLTACQADKMTSSSTKKNLTDKGYSVEVYSEAEAKVRIQNLNYEGISFIDAIVADKGKDDDKDFLIAFFFNSIDEANKFSENDNYKNLGLMNDFADANLGANLTKKVGTHNNVCYVGSETSFSAAFDF